MDRQDGSRMGGGGGQLLDGHAQEINPWDLLPWT